MSGPWLAPPPPCLFWTVARGVGPYIHALLAYLGRRLDGEGAPVRVDQGEGGSGTAAPVPIFLLLLLLLFPVLLAGEEDLLGVDVPRVAPRTNDAVAVRVQTKRLQPRIHIGAQAGLPPFGQEEEEAAPAHVQVVVEGFSLWCGKEEEERGEDGELICWSFFRLVGTETLGLPSPTPDACTL